MLQQYQLDGGYNRLRLIPVTLFFAVGAGFGGFAYGWITHAYDLLPFTPLIWFASAIACGRVLEKGLKWAQNRNLSLAHILIGQATLLWFYFAWAAWATQHNHRFNNFDTPHLVLAPTDLLQYVAIYIHDGPLSVGEWKKNSNFPLSLPRMCFALVEFVGWYGIIWYQVRRHLLLPYFSAKAVFGQIESPWPGYWKHEKGPPTKDSILQDEQFTWLNDIYPSNQQENSLSFSTFTYPGEPTVYLSVYLTTEQQSRRFTNQLADTLLVRNIVLTQECIERLTISYKLKEKRSDNT